MVLPDIFNAKTYHQKKLNSILKSYSLLSRNDIYLQVIHIWFNNYYPNNVQENNAVHFIMLNTTQLKKILDIATNFSIKNSIDIFHVLHKYTFTDKF